MPVVDPVGPCSVPAKVPAASRPKKKRHPGVVLIKPDVVRRIGWRARYVDPDSGKTVKVSLDPSLRTAELRTDWAAKKSKAIERRRRELEDGAPRATGTGLEQAIDRYFADHPHLRERTKKSYRAAADKLLAWANVEGIRSADDLTRAALLSFRARVLNEKKSTMKVGGKRGERVETDETRGAHTVNRELRSVRVVLGYLADADLLPKIREGDLRRATKRVRVPSEAPEYLKPDELQRLLDAALAHDAAVYDATREEHARGGEKGSTTRYEAIAPFVATVLLTGMRFAEALDLEWQQVDLKANEIKLTAATKTHKARSVSLDVSPALARLLAAMHKRSGGHGRVFVDLTEGSIRAALRRLREDYGAPPETNWQILRATCGTFLTNAPGIFGAASAYRSAKQLGHSVTVAEKHYLGVVKVPAKAKNLETAMNIKKHMERIIKSA
jgi:integrase